ncbi:efflux RND transporter periplasmic adaptor subunit [Paenibacillus puldeungensis]|uniref:Efflux RND transporter periplasmic adaptor subunit n=1 Tax=Paenibacillus puldeungensis TaxID=696536 RepID=A0ABW3RWA8_9BACL
MKRRVWIKLTLSCTVFALIAASLTGCTEPAAEKPQTQTVEQKPSVKISKVEKRKIAEPQETVAEVTSSVQRDVFVKATGDVRRALKKRGDHVKKGELLLELDPADVLLQQEKAEIALRTAQQNWKAGYAANQDNPDAQRPLKDQIKLAQLDIEQVERTLNNYKVTAPISGILTDFSAETGMTVTQGTVGKIQQIDPVKIKANITEENAKLIKGKTDLAFYAADRPDQLHTAKIVYFSDMMDTQQRTYTLELQAANPERALKPGTKVQLRLTNEAEQTVLTIPTTSILREENETYVYVYTGGKVAKRVIQLGRLNGLYQEVTQGLKLGEQVVVSGQHQLKDQQTVKAEPADR